MHIVTFLWVFLGAISSTTSFQISSLSRFVVNKGLKMASVNEYRVKIINKKKGSEATITVPSNKYILDVSEQSAVGSIPYSCRAGSCSSCIGRLVEGTVDQSSQIFLDTDKIDQGYVLTCVAYPTSNIEVVVDIEDEFYNTLDTTV